MDRRVNIDWWLDTYSKPLNKPTLDGFSMTMQMMSDRENRALPVPKSGTGKMLPPLPADEFSSKIDLITRYPGLHSSSNFAMPEAKNITISKLAVI